VAAESKYIKGIPGLISLERTGKSFLICCTSNPPSVFTAMENYSPE
jgi:hypothetical protein